MHGDVRRGGGTGREWIPASRHAGEEGGGAWDLGVVVTWPTPTSTQRPPGPGARACWLFWCVSRIYICVCALKWPWSIPAVPGIVGSPELVRDAGYTPHPALYTAVIRGVFVVRCVVARLGASAPAQAVSRQLFARCLWEQVPWRLLRKLCTPLGLGLGSGSGSGVGLGVGLGVWSAAVSCG